MAGIVVGYDGTDSSKAALDAAVDLGKDLGEPVLAVFGYGVNPMGGEVKDHAQALKEHGEESPRKRSSGRVRAAPRPKPCWQIGRGPTPSPRWPRIATPG